MLSRRSFLHSTIRSLAGGALFLLLPGKLLRAAVKEGAYVERSVFAMGTIVSISAFGKDRQHILGATTAAFDELYRLDRLLSVHRGDSDISRLNACSGRREVVVDSDTWNVLSFAKDYHRMTSGAFDVTIESLMERWGFRAQTSQPVASTTEYPVGDEHLLVSDGNVVVIDQLGIKVDTGGIAVGFAVDRMTGILRNHGIQTALINHSGDIYAMGCPEDSNGWKVVVPHPSDPMTPLRTLSLRDKAVSTSANNTNTRNREGRTIGHIFDPKTGSNPRRFKSMTVLSPSSCEADALSTAMFVQDQPGMLGMKGCDYIALRTDRERLETSLR